jgi:ATP-dependent protease HslVU (ClpYQ) peptidase subunit
MTVIVAARTKKDGIVLAADSQESWGWKKLDEQDEKLWAEEAYGYILGACGSVRTAQVIRYYSDWPYPAPKQPLLEFAIKKIIPEVRQATFDHGSQYHSKGLEMMDASVIMAWDDNLIVIDSDYGIFIPISGRIAIGSGESEALGSLGDTGPWTKEDVIEAARVASVSARGVGGAIYFATTKNLAVEKAED